MSGVTPVMPGDSTDSSLIALVDVPPWKASSGNLSTVTCRVSALPRGCWDFGLSLAVLFVVLAGILIVVLLCWVFILRHRLRSAQVGNALEYFGFYRMAQYELKQPSVTVVSPSPSPPTHALSLHIVPPPTPPPRLPPPLFYVTPPIIPCSPPSPHSSWGAGADSEVYSRIGILRPSRASGTSVVSQTQVVLFEHSAL